MRRAVAFALSLTVLLQEPPDAAAAKAKLDEDLAIAAVAVGEQLIKLKAWDEARAFLEVIRAKSDARAESITKLISKTENNTTGVQWSKESSALITSFGTRRAEGYSAYAKQWHDAHPRLAQWCDAEATILVSLLDYVKGFGRLRQIRLHYDLPALQFDWQTSVPALWHAIYLTHNPNDPREIEGKLGYTREGAEAARRSLSSYSESLTDFVASLVHSPFNRDYLLQPRLGKVGFGQSGNAASVVDVQSGLTPPTSATEVVLAIPKRDATDVPTSGYDDTIRILSDKSMKEMGYPIALLFYNAKSAITDVKVALLESMKNIDVYSSSPEKPALPERYPTNKQMILIVPKAPLKPQTQYTVRVEYAVNGKPDKVNWAFRTGR